jgi:penicillin-binding protein A
MSARSTRRFVLFALKAAAVALLLAPRPLHRDALDSWRLELGRKPPREEAGRLVQPLDGGGRIELTLEPPLQKLAAQLLANADPERGAAVLVSVESGRVLALAGRARAQPERNDASLALTAWAPAASVFKLVTAAALLEEGVPPGERVCYHGGLHSLEDDNLDEHAGDRTCKSFAFGLERSQNAVIGRLAFDYLDPRRLERKARALGFGAAPELELPAATSELSVPGEPLAFARMAAGFWHTTLSPLHGAWLAATIARGGETVPLHLVERVVDEEGETLRPSLAPVRRAIAEPEARALAEMMIGTTERGTARVAFHDRRTRKRALGRVLVAGKTGSLNRAAPFLAYSWFVGFAPAERPEVAVAVLLGHDEEGRVKAAEVARELLAGWLAAPRTQPLVAARR